MDKKYNKMKTAKSINHVAAGEYMLNTKQERPTREDNDNDKTCAPLKCFYCCYWSYISLSDNY